MKSRVLLTCASLAISSSVGVSNIYSSAKPKKLGESLTDKRKALRNFDKCRKQFYKTYKQSKKKQGVRKSSIKNTLCNQFRSIKNEARVIKFRTKHCN